MYIKLDKADITFSHYVRSRDRRCMRCSSPVRFNDKGLPISHTNSHYYGRGRENTRFDPLNCDTLCMGCHRIWASDDRESYREFKVKQLGKKGYEHLFIRANTYCKKDRMAMYLVAKKLLSEISC